MTRHSAFSIQPQASQEYWFQSRQPLTCLVFLLPLLVAYELGVLYLGGSDPGALRNGADFWMRGWLQSIGRGYASVLPFLVVAVLLIWHLWSRFPWRLSLETLLGMFAESVLFAFCLIVIAQLQDLTFRTWLAPVSASVPSAIGVHGLALRVVSFLGAGVYEEVMFRLLLLPLCFAFFRLTRVPVNWAAALSVVSTSLLFSLAHYIGPSGDVFLVSTFIFRALAGLFFAGLFVVRGFGITVGCHAAYDLLVGVLLVN